jgi:hypothetical protein
MVVPPGKENPAVNPNFPPHGWQETQSRPVAWCRAWASVEVQVCWPAQAVAAVVAAAAAAARGVLAGAALGATLSPHPQEAARARAVTAWSAELPRLRSRENAMTAPS